MGKNDDSISTHCSIHLSFAAAQFKKPKECSKEKPHAHMQIPPTTCPHPNSMRAAEPFILSIWVEPCVHAANSSPDATVWHTHPLALAQLVQVAQLQIAEAVLERKSLGPLERELRVELVVAEPKWQGGRRKRWLGRLGINSPGGGFSPRLSWDGKEA